MNNATWKLHVVAEKGAPLGNAVALDDIELDIRRQIFLVQLEVKIDRFLDLSKGEADIAIRLGEPSDDALVGRH